MKLALLAVLLAGAPVVSGAVRPRPPARTAAAPTPVASVAPVAPVATPIPGVPVVFQGKTLFRVAARLGSFSAEERATAIGERVERLARKSFAGDLVLRVENGEISTDVLAGETVVFTIFEADASAAGVGRRALAEAAAREVTRAVNEERRAFSVRRVLVDLFLALLSTAALLLVLAGLKKGFPWALARLERWRGTRIPAIRIQKLELLSSSQVTDGLVALARLLRLAAFVAAVVLYVLTVLSIFPWTRSAVAPLYAYAVAPVRILWNGFVGYLPNLFFLLVIAAVAFYGIRVVRLIFIAIERESISVTGFDPEWAMPTYRIFRFLAIAFAAVVAFPYVPGSDSPAFKGVSLFLGLLFSLSSSAAISNIVAGVILTYTRSFRVGDRVRIADTVGDVVEKSLLVTRVRTIKNVDVTIPNSMVLGSHVVNFSTSASAQGLILHTSVTIGYDVPWRKVHELLLGAARATPEVLADPAPFVLQTSLDDFYVSYELNAYTDKPYLMARTYSELHSRIQDAFNEAGVEIMSPHYGALRDGNQTTIPAEHLPPAYTAPPFRLLQVPPTPRRPTGEGGR